MLNKRRSFAFIALCVLLPVMLVLIFLIGGFDSMVRYRAVDIAQLKSKEWHSSWFGIPLSQYPNDLMTYQQIIWEGAPDVIIETGTSHGGLALFLSSLLDYVNPNGKVISIDINCKGARRNFANLTIPNKSRLVDKIILVEASSTDPETIQSIREHVTSDSKVLVILDSLHSREHVSKELEMYGPLVSKGSYLIVNDTHLDRWYPESGPGTGTFGGANPALHDFLAKDKSFQVDASRDRFMVTCAPGGFLKRIDDRILP